MDILYPKHDNGLIIKTTDLYVFWPADKWTVVKII